MVKAIFDAELVLRASETLTATDSSDAKAHPLTPVYYANDAHYETIAVAVRVSAFTASGSTMNYAVQVDSASNFGSPVTVAQLAITSVGEWILPIDLTTVKSLEPSAAFIRDTMTITGGSTPSVTLSSRIIRPNNAAMP